MNNILDFEERQYELELLGKINNVLVLLDEIDDIMDNLPQETSNIELLRSDLEHLLEDKEMGSVGYKNIARELEKVRKQRRHLKKAYEVSKCFKNNRGKITYKDQRPFVRQSLETCFKELQTSYNYRLLNAQNINDLLGTDKEEIVKKERKKRTKFNVTKEELEEDIKNGLKYSDITNKYNVSKVTVFNYLKKWNINYSDLSRKHILPEEAVNIKPKDVTKEMYLELKEKGYNDHDIARYWGMSYVSVWKIKKKLEI